MAEILRERRFIKSDFRKNNNKFWYITEYSDATVVTKYGRVGDSGASTKKSFSSQEQASKFFDSKCKSKQRPKSNGEIGYQELNVAKTNVESLSANDTKEIIKKDFAHCDSEILKLIDRLVDENIHNILNNTTIQYDSESGVFSTPCGVVSKSNIDKARTLLNDISEYVKNQDFFAVEYGHLLNQYLMLIPQNIGRKFDVAKIFKDLDDVQKQNDILDSLDTALETIATSTKTEVEHKKIFNIDLKICTNQKTLDYIKAKYEKSLNSKHVSSNLRIKQVYEINIHNMKKEFDEVKDKIGNVRNLWHGTKTANLLSILKSGLIIPPSNAKHCTGRMFGNGVYFSDQSTKSLNYSYGYWSGSRNSNCFMFLAEVAMGKSYVPSGPMSSLPKAGYDSTFAKAHTSGVQNNEMIVYSTKQCNLKYLIEFSN